MAEVSIPNEDIVLGTILRAGLPFHHGILNYFDSAENAFVSAYRKYKETGHQSFDIHIEYIASPNIDGKILILTDPMLATGSSMDLAYRALLTKGTPKHIHIATIIASKQAIDYCLKNFPEEKPLFGQRPLIQVWMNRRILFRELAMREIWRTGKRCNLY